MNNQTSILINISNLHFTFLLNSKIKHNLISPFFLSFFKEKYPPTEEGYQANQMAVEKIIRESGEAFPIFPENLKHYFFKDVYKKAGCKVVKCSNKNSENASLLYLILNTMGELILNCSILTKVYIPVQVY